MSSLDLELVEAKKFISMATQPGIKQLLGEYVSNIEEALKKIKKEQAAVAASAAPSQLMLFNNNNDNPTSTSLPPTKQVSITSYSWDETDTEVKIYLKLPEGEKSFRELSKIIFCIKTGASEKMLRIDFLLFSNDSSGGGNSEDDDKKSTNLSRFPTEIHSFIVTPLKHELETVSGNFTLEPQVLNNENNNMNNHANGDGHVAVDGKNIDHNKNTNQIFFSTSRAVSSSSSAKSSPSLFVYPGETKTPSGAILRYCRLRVKNNGDVVVGIQKVMPGTWADLIDKDDFNKPLAFGSTGGRSRNDPNVQHTASLVSLMQQLYRDGDDEMRKTIANAWEESRGIPKVEPQ